MRLIRHTLLYMPAQLLGVLAQFAAVLLWTHWLSPADLGTFTIVVALQELAYVGGLFWWSLYTLRYATSHENETRARFDATETAVLLGASAAQAVFAGVALIVALGSEATPELMLWAAAFMVLRGVATQLSERARADQRILAYTVLQGLGPASGIAIGLLGVAYVGPTAAVLLAAQAIGLGAALALAWPLLGFRPSLRHVDRAMLAFALRCSWPLVLGSAIGWVAVNAIRFIVDAELGAEAVGLMAVGWGLGHRAAGVASMLVTAAAFPLAVERLRETDRNGSLDQYAANGALLLAALAPAAVGLVLVAEPVVVLLVAEPFRHETLAILPLAALVGAVRNFRMHFSDQSFLLFERPKLDIFGSSFEAAATVAACWLGLIWGGLVGAVLGCLVATVAAWVLSYALARHAFGIFLRGGDVLRIAGATGLMAMAVGFWPWQASALGLAAQVAFGAAVYGAALAALNRPTLQRLLAARAARAPVGAGGPGA